jgi:hypothetical protein
MKSLENLYFRQFSFVFKKDNAIVGIEPESNQTSIKSASRFIGFPEEKLR